MTRLRTEIVTKVASSLMLAPIGLRARSETSVARRNFSLFALIACAVLSLINMQDATASVYALKVEGMDEPLGIDFEQPRFSWKMAPSSERALVQTAYQIIVTDQSGVVWDSGKVASDHSINIAYAGLELKPTTRYGWTVAAWDNHGRSSVASSSFETGLLNSDPQLSAWGGATWIGPSDEDLPLYASYLSVYDLSFGVTIEPGSERAAIAFAANDARLMDRYKNIFGLENRRGESYFKVELDVGPLAAANEQARLNIYRAGYQRTDDARKPLRSFRISRKLLHTYNRHQPHRISIRAEFGVLTLRFDGADAFFDPEPGESTRTLATVIANPNGAGDVVTFGLLGDIGFSMDAGQRASFRDLVVSHSRPPATAVFREDLSMQPYRGLYQRYANDAHSGLRVKNDAYIVSGMENGVMLLADPSRNAMPMLRTTFGIQDKKIKAARLYATARGVYEFHLNGQRVGNDYYNPGFTQYNRTQFYQTYDVTGLLSGGTNALGVMLGEGWWSGLLGYLPVWNTFGDRPSVLAKLVVSYEDGSADVVTTNDGSWKYFNTGPIVYSSFYMGEVYDATREAAIQDWSTAGYDDREWKKAAQVDLPHTAYRPTWSEFKHDATDNAFDRLSIRGQIGETAKVYRTLIAKSVKEVRKGVFVYDMGQNVVGVPRITFADGKQGQRISLRVAEMLYPDLPQSAENVGMIMTENYRAALSQDTYIMKSGAQVFQPRFTVHGFQYLEITGVDSPPALTEVEALVISSVHALTAHYETSNPKVNQLWSNITWSNVDNFLTLPTDCPQRNERLGWSGDISVFSRTATYISDAGPFLRRHLLALRDTQHPSGRFPDVAPIGGGIGGVLWGSAGITIPWETYMQYGDVAMLREHYPAMVAYIDYLQRDIDPRTGMNVDIELGDWLSPQYSQIGSAVLATAYHIYDLDLMTRIAEALGERKDVARFRKLYRERKDFFNETFVNAEKKTLAYVPRHTSDDRSAVAEFDFRVTDTQSAYAVGLALGAFSDENIPYMQRNLAAAVERENTDDRGVRRPKYSLMTGFIGTAWINDALSQSARPDLAYRLLQNAQYPSWLYPVEQGATTIWERLNSYTVDGGFGGNNGMNSFNHYAFGAVGQWLMTHSLGIQRGEPGFKSFVLHPEPDFTGEMTSASGHYESPYGRIESAWRREGDTLTYTAIVPPNTRATLYLPTVSPKTIREGDLSAGRAPGVNFKRYRDGKAVYALASGSYRFTTKINRVSNSEDRVRP